MLRSCSLSDEQRHDAFHGFRKLYILIDTYMLVWYHYAAELILQQYALEMRIPGSECYASIKRVIRWSGTGVLITGDGCDVWENIL